MLKRPLSLLLAAALLWPSAPVWASSLKTVETVSAGRIQEPLAVKAGPQSFGAASALPLTPSFTAQAGLTNVTLKASAATAQLAGQGAQGALKAPAAFSAQAAAKPVAGQSSQDRSSLPQVRAAVAESGVFDGSGRGKAFAGDAPVAGSHGYNRSGLQAPSGGRSERTAGLPAGASDSVLPKAKPSAGAFSWLRRGVTALMLGAAMLLASCAKEDIQPTQPDAPGIEAYHLTYEQIWEDINKTPSSATLPPNDYFFTVPHHSNDVVFRTRVHADSADITAWLEGVDGAKLHFLLVDDNGDIWAEDNNLTDPYYYDNGFSATVPEGDYFLIIHNNDDPAVGKQSTMEWTIENQ
jgi:hypothetical protein